MPPDQVDAIRDLRHFTTKHRPTLSDTGIRALDLCLDPTRALRDVVVVFVKPRPDSTRVETSFIVTDAEVVPVEFFGPERAEEMRGQLKYVNEENKRMGGPGGILVVLIDTESHVMNAVGMGFGEEVKDMKPGLPWKEKLMEKLNNGIML
ncbi:hypothetical protein BDZ97DRAFT_1817612 [Flammula alnicola]|nr:hypothetical protein BDZ97DRAFT_1817612 [Flammula alnicola]